MKKDSYYFPHDTNAQKDPKCSALISDFGPAGYGLYWAIIEILHQQTDGKLEKFPKLFDGLAFQLKIKKEALLKQIEAMLHDYNLLKQDEKYIWSDRVLRNLETRKNKYLKKVESGRIGGIASGEVRKSKQNEAVLHETKQRKGKERKGKEKKGNILGVSAKLSDSEFFESIKTKDCYKHINIEFEFQKASVWCDAHGKKCSRKFFVNWLNRIEKPMKGLLNGRNNGCLTEDRRKALDELGTTI